MLTVIHGCMFAGKTEELIRRLNRLQYANKTFVLYKPSIDIRYNESMVTTHDGYSLPAIRISSPKEIHPHEYDVVGIDEIQFFKPEIVEIIEMIRQKHDVICAGLSTDYMGQPFETVAYLMALADELVHVKAICIHCGKPATRSYLTISSKSRVNIGGKEKYCALCSECFYRANTQ